MLNRPCWDLIKSAMADELRLSPADEKEQALSDLRMAALERLWRLMGGYEERGFIEALLLPICEKKIQFIKAATTRADLTKNIFNHSAPRYSGGCFHEPKYYIPEEEHGTVVHGIAERAPGAGSQRPVPQDFRSVFSKSKC